MKNLRLYDRFDHIFKDIRSLHFFCIDSLQNVVYMYEEGIVHCFSKEGNNFDSMCIKEECKDISDFQAVALNYNSVLSSVCLATHGGDVLTIDWSCKSVQIMGTVDKGLKAMEWSPDEELLVLITGMDTVILMAATFDPIAEVPLHEISFGEQQFITVGWGKKETQFHGSEGKAAAKANQNATYKPSEKDDKLPRVSWRGDGSLFAVSAVKPDTGGRYIRIFNREGVLQYTSEPVPGLEMTLAWRPSGNLLASSQIIPNKYQIVFFEKNGLRHGEFTLPLPPGEGVVRQVAWNSESDALAVWYEKAQVNHLQLWTVSNYHWYLKQNFLFTEDQNLIGFHWDTEASLTLHVMYLSCGSLYYSIFEWIWCVNYSSVHVPDSKAYVAVIDGSSVLLTSFTECVIPPPMWGDKPQLPSAVSEVVFGPAGCPNRLCAVLDSGQVAVYDAGEKRLLGLGGVQGVERHWGATDSQLHHWCWLGDDTLACVSTVGDSCQLLLVNMDAAGCLSVRQRLQPGGAVVALAASPARPRAVLQTRAGDLLLLDGASAALTPLRAGDPRYHHLLPHWPPGSLQPLVLATAARSRLYADGREIASNITSAFLLPGCLLLTTSGHSLRCLALPAGPSPGGLELPELGGGGRRAERGARLVVAAGTRVVLQMPRGNLETVTPRPLVLLEAGALLERGLLRAAFELFRKQRINLNLLVDHNPGRFFANADRFVEEVANPTWLSLFLAELCEEDVTRTIYAAFYPRERTPFIYPQPGGKVAAVCDRIRAALHMAANPRRFYLPELTSHVRKHRAEDLAAALRLVQTAPEVGLSREAGLQHLLYMADVNELYDTALGLYDFDLVLMIAARSSKDPKEYLPFLNELRHLPEPYRQFRIDKHLRRFGSALEHIVKCPEHLDECLELVRTHGVYGQAMRLFPTGSEGYRRVAAAYAQQLQGQRLYAEAALLLERAGELEAALEASQRAADWPRALRLLVALGAGPERVCSVCRALVANLVQQHRHAEAARLLLRPPLNDPEEAVGVLTQGRLWAEAAHTARDAGREDLMDTHVKPGVRDHFEQLQHEVGNHRRTFASHLARLKIVRATKEMQLEEKDAGGGGDCDLYSDTSSTSGSSHGSHSGSRTSGRSSRSGKNRRKQERKLMSLKEGSAFEDVALVRALHQIISACLAMRKEVRSLCLALLDCSQDADAASLQQGLAAALDLMEASRVEIWPPELLSTSLTSTECFGPDATTNSIIASMVGLPRQRALLQNFDLLEPQLRIPPQVQDQLAWKISILNVV